MQERVLLLHGWGGSDYPHWQSWLAGELAKDYGSVSFPKLDDIDFPNKDEWKEQLKKHLNDFKPNVVICHSLANILWFHMCNEANDEFNMLEVQRLYLIAPPSLTCQIEELKTFFPVDAPKNLHAKEILLVTSTTDQYMYQK